MSSKQHRDLTNYILTSTAQINPHKSTDGRIGYIYAAGFLASYLANILAEDPFRVRQFQKHINDTKNNTKS